MTDNIEKYAYAMLCLNIAFTLLNVTGLFPVSVVIGGFDIVTDLEDNVDAIKDAYLGATGVFDYALLTGSMLINGAKILIEVVVMVLAGVAPLAQALTIPAAFYIPITALVDIIIVYTISKKFLND